MAVFSYIGFLQRQSNNEATKDIFTPKKLHDIVRRAVTSFPTKQEIPHLKNTFWIDYIHVNKLLDKYLEIVADKDKLVCYQNFMGLMPTNMELVLR